MSAMSGYTKLFNSILASTIWREDDKVRIVWITLLAMADKNGVAEGSVPGLADMARVSIDDCKRALQALMAPDEYSRTSSYEGRRIRQVDGGWQLLNHGKYRNKMNADERREYNRKKQAEWRLRKKGVSTRCQQMSNDVNDNNQSLPLSAHTEAEAAPDIESTRARDDDSGPYAPTMGEWIQECARYQIPAFYAETKYEWYAEKQWRSQGQPISWKAAVKRVKRWYENDGRPKAESGSIEDRMFSRK